MSLEVVGNTINGLKGAGFIMNKEDFTSAPSRWTESGDTPTYGVNGAAVAEGDEVTWTYDTTITNFFSASFTGSTGNSSGRKTTLKLTLGSETKELDITGATTNEVEGGGSIIATRIENVWYYIISGATSINGLAGSRIATLGTFTVTGPQIPKVAVKVETASGVITMAGLLTRVMYS
jgi:hypothetical protein